MDMRYRYKLLSQVAVMMTRPTPVAVVHAASKQAYDDLFQSGMTGRLMFAPSAENGRSETL
jgi:hypothetical protein